MPTKEPLFLTILFIFIINHLFVYIFIFIRYLLYLHFKWYPLSELPLQNSLSHSLSPAHPQLPDLQSPILGN